MNRALNKHTCRSVQARALLALVCLVALAGCGKSPQARTERTKVAIPTSSVVSWADSDGDGIPDVAELHSSDDRANFRRWFAYIGEMQFYKLSDAWKADQRDCAGLV